MIAIQEESRAGHLAIMIAKKSARDDQKGRAMRCYESFLRQDTHLCITEVYYTPVTPKRYGFRLRKNPSCGRIARPGRAG